LDIVKAFGLWRTGRKAPAAIDIGSAGAAQLLASLESEISSLAVEVGGVLLSERTRHQCGNCNEADVSPPASSSTSVACCSADVPK
jgi:hypothetical protein